jgi:hypothetical protein
MSILNYRHNDGGKKAEGLGTARSADCCIRAAAIATGDSYKSTKKAMNRLLVEMTGGLDTSCTTGTPTPVSHKYLTDLGYKLTLTKGAYLSDFDFSGRTVICDLPRHTVCVVDNVVNDTWGSHISNRTKCGSPKLLGYYERENRQEPPDEMLSQDLLLNCF